jgi:hypothetical protein
MRPGPRDEVAPHCAGGRGGARFQTDHAHERQQNQFAFRGGWCILRSPAILLPSRVLKTYPLFELIQVFPAGAEEASPADYEVSFFKFAGLDEPVDYHLDDAHIAGRLLGRFD